MDSNEVFKSEITNIIKENISQQLQECLQTIKDDAYLVLSEEDNPAYFSNLKNEFLQYNKYLKPVFQTPTIEIYIVHK